jgi:hypothetical protein
MFHYVKTEIQNINFCHITYVFFVNAVQLFSVKWSLKLANMKHVKNS